MNDQHPPESSEDALEFSPIYQCFENGQLYDHFIADCPLPLEHVMHPLPAPP